MSAISTDGMDKWLDDAYPDLDRRKANMIYEIASLIKDDPDTAPVLIEELVEIMFDEQIDHLEDVIVNHFGVVSIPNRQLNYCHNDSGKIQPISIIMSIYREETLDFKNGNST